MTSAPTVNDADQATPVVPNGFDRLADAVLGFVEALESLLSNRFAHPFTIGSDALRDCAADEVHQGTQSKRILTTLATSQVRAGYVQCDLLRGVAASLRAEKVFFAPFPLARTSVVVAAKSWHVLDADSRVERLHRYLNEELAALYGAPLDPDDEQSRTYVAERTQDYVTIGATAGLRLGRKKKPKPWDAPFLVRAGDPDSKTPESETQLVRSIIEASGFGSDYSNVPYTLLSSATHGRFHRAGVTAYTPAGPSAGGVTVTAMYSPPDTTAQVTIHAAFATFTYLLALARYMDVSEVSVRERLRDSMTAWNAVAQSG
ncbi:hypothetical protein [Mycolicibacterium brisbanense]